MLFNRSVIFPYIFTDEGGFVVRASEPGGAGNMGISFEVFAAWRALQKMPHPTFEDLKLMETPEAEAIYGHEFMDPLRFDALPNAVDYAVMDSGVNLGVTGSIEQLQTLLGVPVTKHLDTVTMAAVAGWQSDSTPLALAVCDAWLETKKKNTAEWPEWGLGWTHRHDKVHARLQTMLTQVHLEAGTTIGTS